jgi:hypothetical protein
VWQLQVVFHESCAADQLVSMCCGRHERDPFAPICRLLSPFFSYPCGLFCGFSQSPKTQLLYSETIPHSFTRGGGMVTMLFLSRNSNLRSPRLAHFSKAAASRYPHSLSYYLPPYFFTSPPLTATRHQPPVTKRCIIPSREHPPERSRMSRPGLSHRKRNHHARILSAFAERPRQRLQPEIESRSCHEPGRNCRPPGLAFAGWTISSPLCQRCGQPRHQV